jgi:hypothetical protein
MIEIKKEKSNKSEVNKLFDSLKKEDLLEDRAEYDEEDLRVAYPKLNEKEARMLYLKIQKWKHSKNRKDKTPKEGGNIILK